MAEGDYVCRDCGQHHETGAEALRCDHERGIERWHKAVGGLHAMATVPGCPLCEAAVRRER